MMRIPIIIFVNVITVVIVIIAIIVIVIITGIIVKTVGAGEDSEVQLWRPGRTSFLFRQVFFAFPQGSFEPQRWLILGVHAV